MTTEKAAIAALNDELSELEAEMSRQREIRAEATYHPELALRERERLWMHLAEASREEGAS